MDIQHRDMVDATAIGRGKNVPPGYEVSWGIVNIVWESFARG